MIKFLKKLWKKYLRDLGYSRIKTAYYKEVKVEKQMPTFMIKPKPLHCERHSRFKKSCQACQEIIK